MDRAAKRELVATLNDVFSNTAVVVVAHYKGLTVADMQKLRTQAKQAGAIVKVARTASPRSLSKARTSHPSRTS